MSLLLDDVDYYIFHVDIARKVEKRLKKPLAPRIDLPLYHLTEFLRVESPTTPSYGERGIL